MEVVLKPLQYSGLHVLRMELVSRGVFDEISAAAVCLFGVGLQLVRFPYWFSSSVPAAVQV